MAYKTVSDAIRETARLMGLVNGQGMTPYSDEAVHSFLTQAHTIIRDHSEWDEMVLRRVRTLDGTTGKITELITDTDDWKDIIRVYHESFQVPLPRVSSKVNPLTSSLTLGYYGLDPASENDGTGKYLVNFLPTTFTGRVLFILKRQVNFDDGDALIPIDFWWHVYLAAWLFATGDGTNPVQISAMEKMIKTREQDVMARENSRPSWWQPNQLIPNDWWEADAPYA